MKTSARIIALVGSLGLLVAAPASAQLRTSEKLYLVSTITDWASTVYAEHTGCCVEGNPLFRPLEQRWGMRTMVTVGLGTDIIGVWLAHKVGTHHPRAERVYLTIFGAAHVVATANNIRLGVQWSLK